MGCVLREAANCESCRFETYLPEKKWYYCGHPFQLSEANVAQKVAWDLICNYMDQIKVSCAYSYLEEQYNNPSPSLVASQIFVHTPDSCELLFGEHRK